MKVVPESDERGGILILAVWTLVMLSLFLAALHFQVRGRLRFVQQTEIRDRLRDTAEAGIRFAMLQASQGDREAADSLRSRWSDSPNLFKDQEVPGGTFTVHWKEEGGKIHYGVTDEERRLNLNTVKTQKILADLLRFGPALGDSEAGDLAASVFDWKDEDDVLNAGGAESRYYKLLPEPYLAKNAPLDSIEELLLIKGVTPEVLIKMEPYITLDGGSPFNINTAPAALMIAYGFSTRLAEAVMVYRAGRDRHAGTEDDQLFTTAGGVGEALAEGAALGEDEIKSVNDFAGSGVFDVKSHTFRAAVTARLDHRREALERTCVFERNGRILRCRESFRVVGTEENENKSQDEVS